MVGVATTSVAPRGSFDPGPYGVRDEKPLLARAAHTWVSHPTSVAGLTWLSTQLTACVLAATAGASRLVWPLPLLPVSRSGDGPRPDRANTSPPTVVASAIAATSSAARRRR